MEESLCDRCRFFNIMNNSCTSFTSDYLQQCLNHIIVENCGSFFSYDDLENINNDDNLTGDLYE